MPRFGRLVGGVALLALAACGVAAERQPAHAPQSAEEAFGRSLPDTAAGAALQARLGDPRLAGPDKEIEREAFEILARDEDALVDAYVRRHGKTVNTDDARELFAAYRADRSRAAAVHEPSSELADKVYARLLDENRGEVDEVVFLAGGGGSGKTTALNRMVRDQGAREAITFDGTFSDPGANMRRITQALDAGYEVSVVYVHVEDPLKALANALDRAERMAAEQGSGRTVSATVLVEQHARARQAFVDAAEELEGDPRVSFQLIDNSGTPDDIELVGGGDEAVAFLRRRLYDADDVELLKHEAEELVEERFRAGEISYRTYRGFSGRVPGEAGPDARGVPSPAQEGGGRARPGVGGSPQAGGQGPGLGWPKAHGQSAGAGAAARTLTSTYPRVRSWLSWSGVFIAANSLAASTQTGGYL